MKQLIIEVFKMLIIIVFQVDQMKIILHRIIYLNLCIKDKMVDG